ncbi:hypothetical protein AVEN_72866-1 [Araneus ventricosus]|uniref:DNA-directed DNA polymerase n=1 Tax=Araneus ventricosus TaxID=182803 RepID=A0A4Y2TLC3_ARAVE|nr:hypothetical protein AVEN_72866-1 [Araneus ventricosus]
MYLFLEQDIRGGVSTITKLYAQASNNYMSNFDPSNPSKYNMYFEANNLYGWAVSQALPLANFKWESSELWNEESIMQIHNEGDTCFVSKVDLEYPEEIHDSHNCLVVATEIMKANKSMLSSYQLNLVDKLEFKISESNGKIIPYLSNKTKYVAHFRNLKLYKELGLRITYVYAALSFKQSPWLESYIRFNTEQRKKAKMDESPPKRFNWGPAMLYTLEGHAVQPPTAAPHEVRFAQPRVQPSHSGSHLSARMAHGNWVVVLEPQSCDVATEES